MEAPLKVWYTGTDRIERYFIKQREAVLKMHQKPIKILMLYGVNCTKQIWDRLIPYLEDYEIDFVEYPHSLTKTAATLDLLTKWVYENYHSNPYDAVIGHSLGGIIALQLAAIYGMKFHTIIYLDTNLKPANAFYRNTMLPKHMQLYGQEVSRMFKEERPFYHEELLKALQEAFDYTADLNKIPQKVYALYGDRGIPEYPKRIEDLNLSGETLARLEIKFVPDSCHMMMIENPKQLAGILKNILDEKETLLP